jgi:ABC-type transport system substrate-binding protein
MSRILWINAPGRSPWSHDSAAAARVLAGRGVKVDILVPGTSVARRNLAQVIQEMWRRAGVTATITSVDFPVFQERLRTGRFQTYVGAWLDEPSPRQLADQWTSAGIGVVNFGHYRNPVFDSLFARAAALRGITGRRQGGLARGPRHPERRRAGDLALQPDQCRRRLPAN